MNRNAIDLGWAPRASSVLNNLQKTNAVLQGGQIRWFAAQKCCFCDGSGPGRGSVRDVVALEKMQQMNFAPGHADGLNGPAELTDRRARRSSPRSVPWHTSSVED